jgi:hypothetical protein
MTPSEQFLKQLLNNQNLQQEITALNFETLQRVAAKHGYVISAAEVDTVLAQSPELVTQLQGLIADADLEFELDEAEMALIAGGGVIDCGGKNVNA